MLQTRAIKNNRRIGKPWLVVQGLYRVHEPWKAAGRRKWETCLVVSEHATQAEAEAALDQQHDAHVQAYNREMDDRADQRLIGNGIEVIAECGTRLGGC